MKKYEKKLYFFEIFISSYAFFKMSQKFHSFLKIPKNKAIYEESAKHNYGNVFFLFKREGFNVKFDLKSLTPSPEKLSPFPLTFGCGDDPSRKSNILTSKSTFKGIQKSDLSILDLWCHGPRMLPNAPTFS